MTDDMLVAAPWSCGSTPPGAVSEPAALDGAGIEWLPIDVPGTAAAALRAAGRWSWGEADTARLDDRDWWFRCRFAAAASSAGPWQLELDGLATLADVWLNGTHLLHSENMFLGHVAQVEHLADANELVLRCSSLTAAATPRQPRARWKSRLVRSQSLRFQRTTLLGRMPGSAPWAAPIGPWRPLRLRPRRPQEIIERSLRAACEETGAGGSLTLRVLLDLRAATPPDATVQIGTERFTLPVIAEAGAGRALIEGTIALAQVERWWPHTHGPQPLYPVTLELDGERHELGRVGFRTITADRSSDGFALIVNGARIFCRGACWNTPDPVAIAADPESVRASIDEARRAGMNMLRIPGYTAYEGKPFWDCADELGLLVWQDCMLASTDPPETPEFTQAITDEIRQVFGELASHPALAVACGSSETYQQAAMFGLPSDGWASPLLEQTIPALLEEIAPGVPYLASSPSGGDPPFTPDRGVAHYFGVGAYLRPPDDARRAGVRFAAECLAFATPPERETIRRAFGRESVAGHDPAWKLGVARDAATSWDFEDVTNHYVRELFGVDPLEVRYADPERALDLARACVCELMSGAMSEWRRGASSCDGALVLSWQDWWPGAGWGLLDAFARPKAPLHALRRVLAPTAVLLVDEGLAGLRTHVIHDGAEPLHARLRVRAFSPSAVEVETAERELAVDPRSALELSAESLLGGFRDLTRAYRFGPPAHDVVAVELLDSDGRELAGAVYLPSGPARPRQPDLGLRAQASPAGGGHWTLSIATRDFAHYVAIDTPGFEPSDSWFHLPPGASTTVTLRDMAASRRPAGSVRALNGPSVPIVLEPER
jgi:beta-mannosidase